MIGSINPSGTNNAMLPNIVRMQNSVVGGWPGFGTKHLIDGSNGTRFVPECPFDGENGGGARVTTPSSIR